MAYPSDYGLSSGFLWILQEARKQMQSLVVVTDVIFLWKHASSINLITFFLDPLRMTMTTTTMRAFWVSAAYLFLQANVVVTLVTPNPVPRFRSASFSSTTARRSMEIQKTKDPHADVEPGVTVDTDTDARPNGLLDRRQVCGVLLASGIMMAPPLSRAAQAAMTIPTPVITADSSALGIGLLESRVTENLLSPPLYGMEGPDVFYPAWFAGTWSVDSVSTSVEAPCGIALFGGNRTYEAALKEIGTNKSLLYESRFVAATTAAGDNQVVTADREYNVKSIAKAAMGPNSVVDIPLATPNKFSCVLSPMGSPSLLRVDLITLNRRQETISDTQFHCSEVVREIVAPIGLQPSAAAANPILKEVETTSLYTYEPNAKKGDPCIRCRQRSAKYVLPSQENELQMYMYAKTRGRPVDVRFYDVFYTKR
jgi:hypothetical protein